jgi:O-antigen ligase
MTEAVPAARVSELTRRRALAIGGAIGWGLAVVVTGVATAYLLAAGLWFVVVALLVALPGFVILNRAPLAALAIWLLLAPYVLFTSGVVRYGFWLVHRALPVVVIVVLIASRVLGLRTRPLGRLGAPELLMVTYIFATVLSIGYTSTTVPTSIITLYDRVVVPMCLYVIVRLVRPTEQSLRWLVPIAAVTVVAQTMLGLAAWVAPGALPDEWLGREGTRTIGSLGSPSVYGVTMLAAGAFLLHAAATEPRRVVRFGERTLFVVSVVMAVGTLTRGVWLAAIVVVAALALVHPRQLRRVAVMALPLLLVLAFTGAAAGQVAKLETRFGSEQTALSRLPVALASWRMFEAKPVAGWGFGNFDEYDREFQAEVSGFIPEKDHASHNVYLTLLAEQGLIGVLLFLGPAAWLLGRTIASYSRLPRTGLASRKLVVLLWAVLLAHVTVNNFSNMRVVFGLGQWWLVLGLIAALVTMPTTSERELQRPVRGSQE